MAFAILILVIIGLAFFYVMLFEYFKKGWNHKPDIMKEYLEYDDEDMDEENPAPGVERCFSILIPARNEEATIIACLNGIICQEYPSALFEIIVLDDNSEDNTSQLVKEFIKDNSQFDIQIISMSDHSGETSNSYKKAAIHKGIESSKYDWIITTDADCTRNKYWLQTIASFIGEKNMMLISAPVAFTYNETFFQQAQALEFLGLIAIGAACIERKAPILCNGANLIYRKDVFYDVDGFDGIDNIASGDDELLMHKIHARYPGRIKFLKHENAIVRTHPCETLGEFISQRRRWVSKSTKYENKKVTLILALSYLVNLGILTIFIIGFFKPIFFTFFILLFGVKVMTEYAFYRTIVDFFGERKLLKWCIPASAMHIVYVLFIGIYGNFGKYNWKGRNVK